MIISFVLDGDGASSKLSRQPILRFGVSPVFSAYAMYPKILFSCGEAQVKETEVLGGEAMEERVYCRRVPSSDGGGAIINIGGVAGGSCGAILGGNGCDAAVRSGKKDKAGGQKPKDTEGVSVGEKKEEGGGSGEKKMEKQSGVGREKKEEGGSGGGEKINKEKVGGWVGEKKDERDSSCEEEEEECGGGGEMKEKVGGGGEMKEKVGAGSEKKKESVGFVGGEKKDEGGASGDMKKAYSIFDAVAEFN